MLETAEFNIPDLEPHNELSQTGEIKDNIKNHIVDLPFALSNDFDNPVVAVNENDELIIAYGHEDGSEVLFLDKDYKIKEKMH